ncbi:MAG TPA: hypothetical protein PLL98_08795 [Bacillota bacterium]|nr:hypothetical protein [Bacillota bacterium]HPL54576.1 hypothetical protein [Bacillota bacterium]
MRHTFKRYAGCLCIILSVFLISRFMPLFLWYSMVVAAVAMIGYLLYNGLFI